MKTLTREDIVLRGHVIQAELIERESTLEAQINTVERLRTEYEGLLAVLAHFFDEDPA